MGEISMKKTVSKLSVLTLAGTIATTAISPSITAFAHENIEDSKSNISVNYNEPGMVSKKDFEEMKREVYKFLVLNEDGTIGISEKMPRSLSYEYDLNSLQKHFDYLNSMVKSGEISINSDFSINQPQARGGINKVVNYWWGASEWYSYSTARHNAKIASQYSNALVGTSILIGAFSKIGGIAVGLGSVYWSTLATNMNYVNDGNGQRGIVIDMNWAGIYSIYSQ